MSHTNGVVARAIALRPPYGPSEVRTLIEGADALLDRGEPYTRDEHRLLDRADKLRVFGPSIEKPPAVPVELLQAIATAAADHEGRRLRAGLALEQVVAARNRAARAKTVDEMTAREAAVRAAERAFALAREDENRARAALCDAQSARDNYLRNAAIAEAQQK